VKKIQTLRFMIVVCGLFIFSACSNKKTAESVTSQNNTEACLASALSNRYVVQWEDGTYSVEYGKSDSDFKKNFTEKKLALIRHVDRDHRIQLKIQSSTDVTASAAGDINWGPEKVEAPAVWAQGFRGENVLVGVVDGMIDSSHPQLVKNIASVQQFNSEINDPIRNKHGSHVSGIIAADPDTGPVAGIAPKAKIIGGQFIANDGGGSLGDAIVAMTSVADRGAKVINLSWGGAPCVENLKFAMEQLSNRGILVVTASGNEGVNTDSSPSYPAAFGVKTQINVAATTFEDFMIYFSNRGYRTVNIGAPGVGIFSTIPGGKIESLDGTSMAAPMISGVAALLMSARPTATVDQIKSVILNTVDLGSNNLQISSRGRVNARRALLELQQILP
jgi:subtilisin family serine protease